MKILIIILLSSVALLFSSFLNISFADDMVKFKLEIKPNQQKVEAYIDGNEHKQVKIRTEYVKLNTVTNNHHIKVTIINTSGQILYHQLALIDKVEHSYVKYPDSTTDYIKSDDGKQITKILPYYNYGNIKPNQATPREWYLSNTGKDEIEIKGYIISKEIPVVLDPKIAAANPDVADTLTKYIKAKMANDLDGILALVAKPSGTFAQNLPAKYIDIYNNYPSSFPRTAFIYLTPKSVSIIGTFCYLNYDWFAPEYGMTYPVTMELQYDGTKWWITE